MEIVSALNGEHILKKSILDLKKSSNSITVKVGCELELFLLGEYGDEFVDDLKNSLFKEFDVIYDLKPEQGIGQYEVNISEIEDLEYLAKVITQIREFINSYCSNNAVKAEFSAKPFKDDCGSAMQFNISIHELGRNLFYKLDNELYKSLVCVLMNYSNEILFLSCSREEEFLRFDLNNNIALFKNKKYVAPTNYSYGVDNRTCLVRCLKNRLEYRLASSSCDVYLMLSALVFCIKKSLTTTLPYENKAIYGNSFEDIYSPRLLEGYEKAKEMFLNGEIHKIFQII